MNADVQTLLRLLGCPVILAPSEAEASCAALCRAKKVYAVATEDMDCLTFGTPVVLRARLLSTFTPPAHASRSRLPLTPPAHTSRSAPR